MDTEAIAEALWREGTDYQREALDAAVAGREAVTPTLVSSLETWAEDPASLFGRDSASLLYTLVLLCHFREPAAHAAVLQLLRADEDTLENLLGDAITELLPRILWYTSSDDAHGLYRLLDDREAYRYSRGAAAEALVIGALNGDLDRERVLDELAERLRTPEFAGPDEQSAIGLFHAMLDLYPDRHEDVLREWVQSGTVSPFDAHESDLDRVLARDREAVLAEERASVHHRLPDDVHGYLAHWHGFQPVRDDDVDPLGPDPGDLGIPPLERRATRPAPPTRDEKKRKRKQQKQARKRNRKRK